ncbi:MAG TPA: hypothetical protein VIX84_15555 [Acidimicrobiales bacterium]
MNVRAMPGENPLRDAAAIGGIGHTESANEIDRPEPQLAGLGPGNEQKQGGHGHHE